MQRTWTRAEDEIDQEEIGMRCVKAIVFSDIVGFTKMMNRSERLGARAIAAKRRIVEPILKKYNGKLVKEIGDGFLMTYDSVVN